MTTRAINGHSLRMLGLILLMLIGLAAAKPSQAQIPDAQATYDGTFWYYYTGSPWSFPVTLTLDSQVADKQGQWASLSGYLWTPDDFYFVSGTIWRSGWTDLYAYDFWGNAFHFYGYLVNNSITVGGKHLSGTWEAYIPGQGYTPLGQFYVSYSTVFHRW